MTAILNQALPLFPLAVVPMPGASMLMRLFEPRYLKMVKEIAAFDQHFFMSLTRPAGPDSDSGFMNKAVLVRLVDFDAGEQGTLQVRVDGLSYCQLSQAAPDADQLWHAQGALWPEPEVDWPPGALVRVLKLYQVMAEHPDVRPLAMPANADAKLALAWLMTVLPLESTQRQMLVDCEHDNQRVQLLLQWVSL